MLPEKVWKSPRKGGYIINWEPLYFCWKNGRYTFGSNRYGKLGRDTDADAGDGFGVVSVEASDGHRPAVASIALGPAGGNQNREAGGKPWWWKMMVGWVGWLVGEVAGCLIFFWEGGDDFLKGSHYLHLK